MGTRKASKAKAGGFPFFFGPLSFIAVVIILLNVTEWSAWVVLPAAFLGLAFLKNGPPPIVFIVLAVLLFNLTDWAWWIVLPVVFVATGILKNRPQAQTKSPYQTAWKWEVPKQSWWAWWNEEHQAAEPVPPASKPKNDERGKPKNDEKPKREAEIHYKDEFVMDDRRYRLGNDGELVEIR